MRTKDLRDGWLVRGLWAVIALTCAVFGAYALSMGLNELGFLLGVNAEAKHRATPVIFVVHSLAGAVALLVGPLQFNRRIRRYVRLHRATGYAYVSSVWIASVF